MNTVIEWANGVAIHWAVRMWPVLWQTAVLAVIVGLIVLVARRMSPALRFWLWMLVPLRLLIMPFIVIALPILASSPVAAPHVAATPPSLASAAAIEATPPNWTAQLMSPAERPSTALQRDARVSIWTWLMAGWAAGIGFFSLRLARGWLRMREIARQARENSDARVRDCAREAAERLPHRQYARTTVLTVIQRLHAKGLLRRRKEAGIFRYSATQQRQQVLSRLITRFVENVLDGSPAPFVAYLTEARNLTPEQKAILEAIVRDLEKREGKR